MSNLHKNFVYFVVAKKGLKINFREKIYLKDPYYFASFGGLFNIKKISRSKNDRNTDQHFFLAIIFNSLIDQTLSKLGI